MKLSEKFVPLGFMALLDALWRKKNGKMNLS